MVGRAVGFDAAFDGGTEAFRQPVTDRAHATVQNAPTLNGNGADDAGQPNPVGTLLVVPPIDRAAAGNPGLLRSSVARHRGLDLADKLSGHHDWINALVGRGAVRDLRHEYRFQSGRSPPT